MPADEHAAFDSYCLELISSPRVSKGFKACLTCVLLLHFEQVHKLFPAHPLNVRMISKASAFGGVDRLMQWGISVRKWFILHNGVFLEPSDVHEGTTIPAKSVHDFTVTAGKALNQLHTLACDNSTAVQNLQCSFGLLVRQFQELATASLQYNNNVNSRLDAIISELGRKRSCEEISPDCPTIPTTAAVAKRSKGSAQATVTGFFEPTVKLAAAKPVKSIAAAADPSALIFGDWTGVKISTAFCRWYQDEIFAVDMLHASSDQVSKLKKLSRLVCYMKLFLGFHCKSGTTITIHRKPAAGSTEHEQYFVDINRLAIVAERHIQDFRFQRCDTKKTTQAAWLKTIHDFLFGRSDFPTDVVENVVDLATPPMFNHKDLKVEPMAKTKANNVL